MQQLELSINYIEIVTIFQSLDPHLQTEYLQLLQDEYTLINGPINESQIERREDYEYYHIYKIIDLFYNHYDKNNFSGILERYIYKILDKDPNLFDFLLHLSVSLREYLNDVSGVFFDGGSI
jgi:hypothetical protein